MKREEWTPSRHQYLCSEHFTEDCFDIRWGIRYLKNTAIPTIFPSVEDVCYLSIDTPKTQDLDQIKAPWYLCKHFLQVKEGNVEEHSFTCSLKAIES